MNSAHLPDNDAYPIIVAPTVTRYTTYPVIVAKFTKSTQPAPNPTPQPKQKTGAAPAAPVNHSNHHILPSFFAIAYTGLLNTLSKVPGSSSIYGVKPRLKR